MTFMDYLVHCHSNRFGIWNFWSLGRCIKFFVTFLGSFFAYGSFYCCARGPMLPGCALATQGVTDLPESLFRCFVSTGFHIKTRIKEVLADLWTQVNALLSFCGFNVVANLCLWKKIQNILFKKQNFLKRKMSFNAFCLFYSLKLEITEK